MSGEDAGSVAPTLVYRSREGMVGGVFVLGLIGLVVVVGIIDDADATPAWMYAGSAVLAMLVWMAMIRPRVCSDGTQLELRAMAETAWVPLAAITGLEVRHVLEVRVGQERITSAAVGRTRRQLTRDLRVRPTRGLDGLVAEAETPRESAGAVAEAQLLRAVEEARSRARVAGADLGEDQVRRSRAWPEIVLLAGAVVALVVTLLL